MRVFVVHNAEFQTSLMYFDSAFCTRGLISFLCVYRQTNSSQPIGHRPWGVTVVISVDQPSHIPAHQILLLQGTFGFPYYTVSLLLLLLA